MAMSFFTMHQGCLILASAVLSYQTLAYNQTLGSTDIEPAKLSSFGTICENAEIWQLLTGDSSIDSASNIPFPKVMAGITQALQDYDFNIQSKQSAVKALEPRIQKALENEKVPTMTAAETDALVAKAVEPFTSVEKAKTYKCGRARNRKDKTVPRKAYDLSIAGFEKYASEFFQGQVHFSRVTFQERFKALIGVEGVEEGSYCRQLCNSLAGIAQKASGKMTVPESAGLISQRKRLEKELQELEEKKAQCLSAEESMKAFKAVMAEQMEEVEARHEDWRKASEAMDDAEEQLTALEDDLAEGEEKLGKVMEELKSNEKSVTDAKTALAGITAKAGVLKGLLDATNEKIAEVSERTAKAKRASGVIDGLRSAVSLATLKMRLFYEAAALRPVENAGLSQSTNIEGGDYFFASMDSVPGESKMREGVEDLRKFCDDEAIPAFKAVKAVDLTSLCPDEKLGADVIVTGIRTSLEDKIKQVKKTLVEIQTWFDPLKGQDALTKEDVAARRDAGEPEGLREIMAVYMYSKFYQKYLKEWTLRGKFLGLIAELGNMIVDLSTRLEKLQADLEKVQEAYSKMLEERKAAEKKLDEASKARDLSAGQRKELEKAVEDLKAQTDQMTSSYDDFVQKEQEAFQRYQEAKKNLLEVYKQGTSLAELAEAAEQGLLAEA